MSRESEIPAPRSRRQITDDEIEQIHDSLRGLEFGVVEITVQDGVIVQIDRTEKRRLRRLTANRNA